MLIFTLILACHRGDEAPAPAAADLDHRAYVVCELSNELFVFDYNTLSEVASLDVTADLSSGAANGDHMAMVTEDGEKVYYGISTAYMWACAPQYSILTVLLADIEDDGTLPETFDHERWAYLCIPYWDRGLQYTCFAGEAGARLGDTLGEGAPSRVNGVTYEGDDQVYHAGRVFYSHQLTSAGRQKIKYFACPDVDFLDLAVPT